MKAAGAFNGLPRELAPTATARHSRRATECPLFIQKGQNSRLCDSRSRWSLMVAGCPLLGVKRTYACALQMSAFDPKRKCDNWNFARPTALVCMPQQENADRARAERIFKAREQQRAEGPKATADYYAALQRIRDRTQELRRLRLDHEAQKKIHRE